MVHLREGILLPRDSLVDRDRTVTSATDKLVQVVAPASLCVSNLGFVHGRTREEVRYQQATDAH